MTMPTRSTQYGLLTATLMLGAILLTPVTWLGNLQLHTVIEVLATTLSLIVGILALIRYYSKPDNTFLFLGAAFIGTAILDGYHTVLTATTITVPLTAYQAAVLPWSWLSSRLFLSIMLCLGWLAWRRESQLGTAGLVPERTVYFSVLGLTVVSICFFVLLPIPDAYQSGWMFSRPQELIPTFFFALTTWAYLSKGTWRYSSYEHWFVCSLIIETLGQAFYMSRSQQLNDIMFVTNHFLKVISYSCVLVGLLSNTYLIFRRLEMHSARVKKSAVALQAAYTDVEETAREQSVALAHTNTILLKTQAECEHIELRLQHRTKEQAVLSLLGADIVSGRDLSLLLQKAISIVADTLTLDYTTVVRLLPQELSKRLMPATQPAQDPFPIFTKLQAVEPLLRTPDLFRPAVPTQQIPALSESDSHFIKIVAQFLCAAIERMRAEAELQASVERFELAAQGTHDGIWDTWINQHQPLDPTSQVYYSPRFLSLIGYDLAEFPPVLDSWLSCIHPQDKGLFLDSLTQHIDLHLPCDVQLRMVTKRGDIRWFTMRGQATWNSIGQALRMAGSLRDITDERILQSQLFHAQKMDAIGRLASGVAHDFNNLLTVIRGYSDLIGRQPTDPTTVTTRIKEIQKATSRATTLTSRLLTFSRHEVHEARVVPLNHVITESEGFLRRLIGEDMQIAYTLTSATCHVLVDPVSLEQAIVNLVCNARDAMPDGGQITIGTTIVDPHALVGRIPTSAHVGPYVALTVRDTGQGMDAETQARIFEPFFTTKAAGKGTGLGLAIVYNVVQQSRGTIVVDSAPSMGTTFTIYLPCVDAAVQSEPVQPLTIASPITPATILLVEDETSVRTLTKTVLEEQGYTVIEAASGPEAITSAQHYAHDIQLVLTDTIMPQMSGPVMVKTLREHRPTLKILYMSGYSEATLPLGPDACFIKKPFSPSVLHRRIQEILTSPTLQVSDLLADTSQPKRVLILDDDEQLAPMLATMLRSAGHEVWTTHNGNDAMTYLKDHPIDLVMTDMLMPEVDGLMMITHIRESYPHIALIAMSGGGRAPARFYLELAKKNGAQHTLLKPFSQDEVLHLFEQATASP